MGNQPSLPELLHSAVAKNDIARFQSLAAAFGQRPGGQPVDPDLRRRVLEYQDKNGRTPLLLAAARNHYQIAQQLIALGADIHFINTACDAAGGALHEAAARRHEAVVELLLSAGANPFAANAAGRTALDEAVLAGHAGVVRAIEKRALFSGLVEVKCCAMLRSKYKTRWAVLMLYFPLPGGSGGRVGPAAAGLTGGAAAPGVRRCLWLYKNEGSVSPRCRLWLDGAQATTDGPSGTPWCTLRLATSHSEPVGNVYTRYDRGFCLYLRPVDGVKYGGAQAVAAYNRLVGLINVPANVPLGLGTWQQAPPAAPSALPPTTPPPAAAAAAAASLAGGRYPPIPPAAASPPLPPPPPLQQNRCAQQQQASPQRAADSPAHRTTSEPTLQPLQPLPGPPYSVNRTGGNTGLPPLPHSSGRPRPGPDASQQRFIEALAALPGESDAEFAARLASAFSVASGQSQEHLYPLHVQQQAPSSSTPRPSPLVDASVNSQSDPGAHPWGSSPGPTTPRHAVGRNGGNDLDLAAVNEVIAASTTAAAAAAAAPGRSAGGPSPPLPSKVEAPTAPPAPAAARAAGAAERRATLDDAELCIICLAAPKEVGLLHGDSVHRCVCKGCAPYLGTGAPCPLCRQPVERLLGVY